MILAKLTFWFALLGVVSAQVVTPDNTCGPAKGYVCNPADTFGGACCSSSGYCGNTDAYCGAGCQPAYGTCTNGAVNVPGVGVFTHTANYTFSGSALPSGLRVNLDKIPKSPTASYDAQMAAANVNVTGGLLVLKVPGNQNTNPITGGAVQTSDQGILYASVRVKAKLSSVKGVCDGFFFYRSDNAEIDLEYLSDPSSAANNGINPPPLQYTNHGTGNTHTTVTAPTDATTAFHEYRVDWVPGKVTFYTDGKSTQVFTTDVPSIAGTWIFNVWSSGDPQWSAGPPLADATLSISNILMYYNTTSTS